MEERVAPATREKIRGGAAQIVVHGRRRSLAYCGRQRNAFRAQWRSVVFAETEWSDLLLEGRSDGLRAETRGPAILP